MAAIQIDAQLVEKLQQLAAERSMTVDQFLEEALSNYLRQGEQQEMEYNVQVFQEKLGELRQSYGDEFVAISAGAIVDHDKDFQAIHYRIRQQYGRQPVLIRQVAAPEREWAFRSPRIERSSP